MNIKGSAKTPGSGRKKGTRNKNSAPCQEKARELGIDPFSTLLLFAEGKWKELGYPTETYLVHGAGQTNEKYYIEPSVRAKCASDACRYLYPTLKAVTVTKEPEDRPLEGLTDEELDAL